jgi:hypothetical protein
MGGAGGPGPSSCEDGSQDARERMQGAAELTLRHPEQPRQIARKGKRSPRA